MQNRVLSEVYLGTEHKYFIKHSDFIIQNFLSQIWMIVIVG